MKLTFAAGILVAATPICAYTRNRGAAAITYVKAAGINVGSFACKGLPGVFDSDRSPRDPNDSAQAYLTTIKAQGNCNTTPCIGVCSIDLAENPVAAQSILLGLLGERKASCETNRGIYNSKLVYPISIAWS